jgi:RNA polymerase sigma factor (sigma-70 family)
VSESLSGLGDADLVAHLGGGGSASLEVQDLFTSLWRAPEKYEPGKGQLPTWLTSIAHPRAGDRVRRQAARPVTVPLDDYLTVADSLATSTQDAAFAQADTQRLREALARLPTTQNRSLALAYFGGRTQREIAEIMGCPLDTVKTWCRAGMRSLAGALADLGADGARVATVPRPAARATARTEAHRG